MSLFQNGFQQSSLYTSLDPFPTVLSFLQCTRCMPLTWRKYSLTVCRTQSDPFSNTRLLQAFAPIREENFHIVNPITSIPFGPLQLQESMALIARSHILSSAISYFVRAEVFPREEPERIRSDGIIKELSAAIQPDIEQVLDYSCLSMSFWKPFLAGLCPVTGPRTAVDWRNGLQSLKNIFEQQRHIFIPHYNSKKNMGYKTQQLFWNTLNSDFLSAPHHNITPCDLIRHYHETGEQIQGPMEMRFAWRYNDLKGRVYYATGGECLWPGLFIKQIAKDILSLLPSTNPFTRFDSRRVTFRPLDDGEVMITYDYSSFTTSLAELKYFLTYLARALSDIDFRCLDLYHGIMEINLGDYIDNYNKTINMSPVFDVDRLDICELSTLLVQTRNGMLGAQGNIAFSTLLHGLAAGYINDDPGSTCVVGDDALLRIWEEALQESISRINLLGVVEESKAHVWHNVSAYDEDFTTQGLSQAWQFLKRPLNLDGFGQVQIGVMPAFPSYGDAFSMGDDYHVTRDASPCQRFITFAKQWGRFLIAGYLNPSDIDIVEATMILAPVNAVYEKFSIPKDGLPIGSRIEFGRESIVTPVTIPSCRHEVLYENWIDLHARFYKGSSVLIPVIVDFSIPAGVCYGVGHVIEACTLHRIQKIMEDLGYFRIELIKREVVLSDETLEDLRALICGKGNRTVHKITCIREPPVWYNEVIYDEGPE